MRPFRVALVVVGVVTLISFLDPTEAIVQIRNGSITVNTETPTVLRQWDGWIDRMTRAKELRLRQVRRDTLVDGRTHERYAQYYEGVPIFGADVARQLNRGLTVSIFGTAYTDVTLDTTPTLSQQQASKIIETLSETVLSKSRTPEITILPRDTNDESYVLTYRARVMSPTGLTMYFIDAHSGETVLQFSDLKTQQANLPCGDCNVGDATGVLGDRKKISVKSTAGVCMASDGLRPPALRTFDMRGNLKNTIDFLNGVRPLFDSDLATDTDNVWTDGANVDAHVYTGLTYDYLFKRFSRLGLDNNNIEITSLVHPVDRSDVFTASWDVLFTFYLNAFYYGDGIMVYGEGLPSGITFSDKSWNFFSTGLDVIAHELTHGVTDFSSQLIYQNESGALNEAFSDIIGTSAEFFFQDTGNGLRMADYFIGEDIAVPDGIRSMKNPQLFGDPDHFSNRFTGSWDNGGVHINSSIATMRSISRLKVEKIGLPE